jgi:hypothetical protein
VKKEMFSESHHHTNKRRIREKSGDDVNDDARLQKQKERSRKGNDGEQSISFRKLNHNKISTCNECGTPIKFDRDIVSPNGKPIPLERSDHYGDDHHHSLRPHFCKVKELYLIEKWRTFFESGRLKHFKVKMIVESIHEGEE